MQFADALGEHVWHMSLIKTSAQTDALSLDEAW